MSDMLFDDPYEWALTRDDLIRERVKPRTIRADRGNHRLCIRCGKTLNNECLRCTLKDSFGEA